MSKREMSRGVQQALYKYLPGSWIDFSSKTEDGRENFIAQVEMWRGIPLQGINHRRLLRVVNQEIKSFMGKTEGFPNEINEATCQVLTPRITEGDSAIVATISPLTAVCSNPKCGRTITHKDSEKYLRFKYKRCSCGGEFKQINLIHFCSCGHAEPLKIFPCRNKEHGWDHIKRLDSFINFICDKCKQKIGIMRKCPQCGQQINVRPATDNAHFCPFTVSLIDLLDKSKDAFIDNEQNFRGEKTIIAQYLDYITQTEYQEVLQKGRIVDGADFDAELEEERKKHIGLDESIIEMILDNLRQQKGQSSIGKALVKIDQVFANLDQAKIRPTVEQILEYDELLSTPNILTLEKASSDAASVNDGYEKDYRSIAEAFGFSNVSVCSDIPIVSAAYGYTRKERTPDKAVLHGLKQEFRDKKNVYATRLETEGILFEFDRKRILMWLFENGFVEEKDIPKEMTEENLKTWFLEKINAAEIRTFTHIDTIYKETRLVYRLIHSISHILITQAAEICGLDKSSLSEYILPNIPAVFIYCQNSQGFNMGALYNTFQMYFDKWLKNAKEAVKKCIFDPICIDKEKACAGCLFLNEVSCKHFNKDLERGFICGYFDKENSKRIKGFWED